MIILTLDFSFDKSLREQTPFIQQNMERLLGSVQEVLDQTE